MGRRVGGVVAAVALSCALAAPVAVAVQHSPPARRQAVLFGDSFVVEAGPTWRFILDHSGIDADVHAFGGTAPCDWFNDIAETVDRVRPAVVVFSYVGSALTPCMRGPNGEPLLPDEVTARYREDAEWATELAGRYGATVMWTDGPVPLAPPPGYYDVRAVFQDLARAHPRTQYIDGDEMIAPNGVYRQARPCLFFEPCEAAGQNIVRAPDGNHFCPAGIPSADDLANGNHCPVYSSGAARYAIDLARPVMAAMQAGP